MILTATALKGAIGKSTWPQVLTRLGIYLEPFVSVSIEEYHEFHKNNKSYNKLRAKKAKKKKSKDSKSKKGKEGDSDDEDPQSPSGAKESSKTPETPGTPGSSFVSENDPLSETIIDLNDHPNRERNLQYHSHESASYHYPTVGELERSFPWDRAMLLLESEMTRGHNWLKSVTMYESALAHYVEFDEAFKRVNHALTKSPGLPHSPQTRSRKFTLRCLHAMKQFCKYSEIKHGEILDLELKEVPSLNYIEMVITANRSSMIQFKGLEIKFPRWSGELASWLEFSIEVQSFLHGNGLGSLIPNSSSTTHVHKRNAHKARIEALAWIDAKFLTALIIAIHHKESKQCRLDFINEVRWGTKMAKGSSLWKLLTDTFEHEQLTSERIQFHTQKMNDVKAGMNDPTHLDSQTANVNMARASVIPLLKKLDSKESAEEFKKHYLLTVANETVRINLDQASTPT